MFRCGVSRTTSVIPSDAGALSGAEAEPMNEPNGPLDRLEARLERLTARVDELSRALELRELAAAAKPPKADACDPTRRRRRDHVGHTSRV
jgi:hypothetical protein